MKKHFAIFIFVILAIGLCVPAVFAQTGTVKGTCKDAQGNPIADGMVVFANIDNGQKYRSRPTRRANIFRWVSPPASTTSRCTKPLTT